MSQKQQEWLISIDVGIKNLAMCVFSIEPETKKHDIEIWDVINISDAESASSMASEQPLVCSFVTTPNTKTSPTKRSRGSSMGKSLDAFFGVSSAQTPQHKQEQEQEQEQEKTCCGKPAKYFHNIDGGITFFCTVHAKKSNYVIPSATETPDFHYKTVKKMKAHELQEYFNRHPLLSMPTTHEKKKAKKEDLLGMVEKYIRSKCLQPIEPKIKNVAFINLVVLGRNMMKHLDHLLSRGFDKIRTIVIENQISPIAQRMSSLQGMLTQYFIMRVPGCNIVFASSANKLKVCLGDPGAGDTGASDSNTIAPPAPAKTGTGDKKAYSERKKKSIDICTKLISRDFPTKWLDVLNHHKKKDDMCDSFLQGMWYIGKVVSS